MKKVAVAISGQFRWHKDAIQSIKKHLIEPNDADVFFVFSDQTNNNYKKIQKNEIESKVNSMFPEGYCKLSIVTDTIFKLLKPNASFADDMNSELEILKDRIHPRNKKMELASIDIELQEKNRGKKYESIIYVRPTLVLKEKIILKNLKNNTVYAFGKYFSGPGYNNIPRNWDGIYYANSETFHKASRNLVGNFPSIVGIKEDPKELFEKIRHDWFLFSPEITLTYNWVVRRGLTIEFFKTNKMYFYGAGKNSIRTYTYSNLKPIKGSIANKLPNDYKLPKKFVNKELAHLY